MFLLLAFFITSTNTISASTVAEFNSADACDAAKNQVYQSIPSGNKVLLCVAK